MLKITAIRHAWPEHAGFVIERKNGHTDYSFIHFTNGAVIRLGGEEISVPHHTCILYRPGTPQYLYSDQPLIHDWLHFTGDPTDFLEPLNIRADAMLHPVRSDFITDIVQEMENEFYAGRSEREILLDLKLRELFLKLSRSLSGEAAAAVDTSMSERLRKLRGEIYLSLGHPWTVGEMASRVGLSESRFYSVYRSVYGCSPMDDLIRARIDAARNALLFSSQSVTSVAESLGYSNVTHFIRQFRRFTGTSPSRYRKEGTDH